MTLLLKLIQVHYIFLFLFLYLFLPLFQIFFHSIFFLLIPSSIKISFQSNLYKYHQISLINLSSKFQILRLHYSLLSLCTYNNKTVLQNLITHYFHNFNLFYFSQIFSKLSNLFNKNSCFHLPPFNFQNPLIISINLLFFSTLITPLL
jgi:hypothetical protein